MFPRRVLGPAVRAPGPRQFTLSAGRLPVSPSFSRPTLCRHREVSVCARWAGSSGAAAPGATARPLPGYPAERNRLSQVEPVAGTVETSFTAHRTGALQPPDSCGASWHPSPSPKVSAGRRATFFAYGRAGVCPVAATRVLGPRPAAPVRGVAASGFADGAVPRQPFASARTAPSRGTHGPLAAASYVLGWPAAVFASYGLSSAVGRTLAPAPGPSIIDAAQDHPLAP